jgi:hypothetical protein
MAMLNNQRVIQDNSEDINVRVSDWHPSWLPQLVLDVLDVLGMFKPPSRVHRITKASIGLKAPVRNGWCWNCWRSRRNRELSAAALMFGFRNWGTNGPTRVVIYYLSISNFFWMIWIWRFPEKWYPQENHPFIDGIFHDESIYRWDFPWLIHL